MNRRRVGTAMFYVGQVAIVCGIGLKSLPWAFVVGGVLMIINGVSLMSKAEEVDNGGSKQP